MLVFQVRDIFFQVLHPATTLTYLAVIIVGAVALNHPLFLLALFLPIFLALAVSGGMEAWLKSARFFLVLIVMLLAINTLVNQMGSTVLLFGPVLPAMGRVTVTLETLIFALVMGIRLLTVFTAFILYNFVVNPDRALSMFARLFPRSALLVALTTKTIPYLSQKLQSAGEIAQCRGVNFHTGGRFARVKNRLPLIRVLFMSSLEDSFNIGESIQARAYGSGPRTNYFCQQFRAGDFLIMAAAIAALLLMTLSLIWGWGSFSFYPRLQGWILSQYQLAALLGTWLLLMIPVLLAWGWSKWNFIRWKI
jgi:energy-coupling factor transport system permease protein